MTCLINEFNLFHCFHLKYKPFYLKYNTCSKRQSAVIQKYIIIIFVWSGRLFTYWNNRRPTFGGVIWWYFGEAGQQVMWSPPMPVQRYLLTYIIWDHLQVTLKGINMCCRSANSLWPVTSFTNEVNSRLVKCPLTFNGCLAKCGLTSLVKEATGDA